MLKVVTLIIISQDQVVTLVKLCCSCVDGICISKDGIIFDCLCLCLRSLPNCKVTEGLYEVYNNGGATGLLGTLPVDF